MSPKTEVTSFADDTRLLGEISEKADCDGLQSDLEKVYSWAEESGMMFNAGKFEVLRFWPDRDQAPVAQYLAPDESSITEKMSTRDLGVRISGELNFKEQIDLVIQGASQMAGWALRTFRRRGTVLMLTVLRTLIQPRLDYCSQLWSPCDQASINRLEAVQRHFLSQIKDESLAGLDYWQKLSALKVQSQERRREFAQICFIWKISQGLLKGYSLNLSISDRGGRTAIPNPIKRSAPGKVRQARECSLGVHGVRLFNILPKQLRNENSGDIDLFKNHLEIFLSTIPDQPTVPGLKRAAASNSLLDQVHFNTIDNLEA